jgi:uncharacterized repeat protein (TIGR01451 family)
MAWLRALWPTRALAVLALLACLPARADTALSNVKSFRGNVNFTGTEVTLRSSSNSSNACQLVTNSTASATLKGIPSGATIESAQLYYAASGSTVDNTVTMDTTSYTARNTYQSSTVGYDYFAGAVDVTAAVKQKGNATYTFSGLSVNSGNPWCGVQGVVGGFALVVVYSMSSEPFRMLNIYEGFQYFQNNGFTINLGNFNVPNPLPSNVTGRIGHITWEGDNTISGGGETLLFNNVELTDSMNPSGNQFNSQSNINADYYSYGVDFDAYTLTAANGTLTPGSSTATTTYKTGQDLVLLSAEIVAMPYVANADLALTMTRSGDLTANSTASYAITVTNKGIDTEIGPVTVTDTLPSGLSYISAAGAGWSCTSAAGSGGATIVTCSQNGPLAPGATMSTLVLNVAASANANYTNTATVSGKTGDDTSGNNSASNTYTMPASSTYGYQAAFTRETCKVGDPIVVLDSAAGCHTFIGPVIAGDSNTKIYITGVTTNSKGQQIASAVSGSSTSVSINFAASCAPNSGVGVSYAGLTLNCNGTPQSATVTVSGNQATASNVSSFFYADVGRVILTASYNGTQVGSISMISKPYDVRVRAAIRDLGGATEYYDQKGTSADSFGKPDLAFVRAGDPFTLRLGAWMANGAWAPSFGKEPAELAGKMDPSLLVFKFGLDKFTVTSPQTSPVSQLTQITLPGQNAPVSPDSLVQNAFVINQGFAANSAAGAFDAKVSWFEAGNLALVPSLENYLGAGTVPSADNTASATRMGPSTRVIGRFYPDHLDTDITKAFDCPASLNCPPAAYDAAKPSWPIAGAVYSGQPFAVNVHAYGLPMADGSLPQLRLFQNVPPSNVTAPMSSNARTTIVLSAVPLPNASGAVTSSNKQPVSFSSQVVPYSSASTDYLDLGTSATMTVPVAFSAANRTATNVGAPALFYVRASMTETRQASTGGAAQVINVNSVAPTTPAGTQYEDGLMALNGRLQVGNALGAEALRLPVPLTAQYWSGTSWLTNTADNDSLVAATAPWSGSVPAPACSGGLAASPPATTCKSGVVSAVNNGTAIRLNAGRATMVLQQAAPGRLNGSIDYQVMGGDSAAWLPSTQARAKFGLYKAPVIYLREVY